MKKQFVERTIEVATLTYWHPFIKDSQVGVQILLYLIIQLPLASLLFSLKVKESCRV